MENWCYDRADADGHDRVTGRPVNPCPRTSSTSSWRRARSWAGSAILRQVHFGLVDLALHSAGHPRRARAPSDLRRQIASDHHGAPPHSGGRLPLRLRPHLRGRVRRRLLLLQVGRGAVSADAFSAFEEVGLDDEAAVAATGRRFRDTVLSLGGSRAPPRSSRAFRGREPSPEALIRHSGLVAA